MYIFHSSNGIELNPNEITIPRDKKSNFKFLEYAEITKFYRRCHIFFQPIEKPKVC